MLGTHFNCVSLREFPGAPEVEEDAPDFSGNAAKKAVGIACWLSSAYPEQKDSFVLADDSGLEVDALGGAPGVFSARFAAMDSGRAGNSADTENNAKLLGLLKDVPPEKRTARFRCVAALCPVLRATQPGSSVTRADGLKGATEFFEGKCEGRISFAPAGSRGFGYDPLFIPDGYNESFAQLGEPIKNVISHRAKALAKLKDWLQMKTERS